MKEVKAAIVLIFICAVACFGALFLLNGCKWEPMIATENPEFNRRVKFIEYLSSENSAMPHHRITFMEIDNHKYILYHRNPGMNDAVGGMVHDPECKCHGEKK